MQYWFIENLILLRKEVKRIFYLSSCLWQLGNGLKSEKSICLSEKSVCLICLEEKMEKKILEGELITVPKYRGTVVSSHKGFSYIGGVRRGSETINTNGDVFVPQELLPGEVVEFDSMELDEKRTKPGEKKFRTELAVVVSSEHVPGVIGSSPADIVLYASRQRSAYHYNAKEIDQEKVRKAAENEPFIEMMGLARECAEEKIKERDIVTIAENFLKNTFASFSTMNVSYSIKGNVKTDDEKKSIQAIAEEYEKAGLYAQKTSILQEYEYFSGVRDVFTLMEKEELLHMDAVIPIRHLPDLLVMAPVWYVDKKNLISSSLFIQYFCDEVGTKEFANLFQLYNRNCRLTENFDSRRDIIPVPIMKILEKAREIFDFTVIATPYHDLASEEWKTTWTRNIDPFLFGFVRGLPYMFLLGRWSGTGLFPLMCEMVADTIEHLRQNYKALEKIALGDNNTIYFYDIGIKTWEGITGKQLSEFAQNVVKAFDEGRL